MPKPDVVGVLECAYDLRGTDSSWMRQVTDAVHPLFDYGLGTVSFSYQVDASMRTRVGEVFQIGTPQDFEPHLRQMQEHVPPPVVEAIYLAPGGVGTIPEVTGATAQEAARALFSTWGDVLADIMGMTAYHLGGWGFMITAPMPDSRKSTATERNRWLRVLPHLRAGMRLRRHVLDEDGDAVLTPTGERPSRKSCFLCNELDAAVDQGGDDPSSMHQVRYVLLRHCPCGEPQLSVRPQEARHRVDSLRSRDCAWQVPRRRPIAGPRVRLHEQPLPLAHHRPRRMCSRCDSGYPFGEPRRDMKAGSA